MSKADMLNRLADGRSIPERFSKNFQIKRAGRDKDDLFWWFGKIHGLENLALCDMEDILKCNGNPYELQKLVNEANDKPKKVEFFSFDKLIEGVNTKMNAHAQHLDSHPLQYNSSDRKKLLALPF